MWFEEEPAEHEKTDEDDNGERRAEAADGRSRPLVVERRTNGRTGTHSPQIYPHREGVACVSEIRQLGGREIAVMMTKRDRAGRGLFIAFGVTFPLSGNQRITFKIHQRNLRAYVSLL